MPRHLQREIEALKRDILMIGTAVEEAIDQAFRAAEQRDVELAKKVVEKDSLIDEWEIEIEESCLKLLALYRPREKQLRFIVAAMKMNSDLERMGDLAANFAEMTLKLSKADDGFSLPEHLKEMVSLTRGMVGKTIEAMVQENAEMAGKVTAEDSKIDAMHEKTFEVVENKLCDEPQNVKYHMAVVTLSRYLERIADHATNIAEDIVYLLTGSIIRHRAGDFFGENGEPGS